MRVDFRRWQHRLVVSLLGWVVPVGVYGQSWAGLSASNYGGTQAAAVNPSALADNRYRLYMNVAAGGVNLFNNYLKVNAPYGAWALTVGRVADRYRDGRGNVVFREAYLRESLNGRTKYVTLSGDARLPAVAVALPHGQAVAFGSRVRAYVQLNNVSENLARISHFGLGRADDLGLANLALTDTRFTFNLNAWQEFAGSYARELTPNQRHFWKAGATVKYLVGLGGGFIANDGLGYAVYNSDSIQVRDRNVRYGYTDYRYYARANDFRLGNLYGRNRLGRGMGLDLGLTYEFRPDFDDHTYAMDGQTGLPNPTVNKYRLRLGLAVVDLGRVQYRHDGYVSASALTETGTVQLGQLDTLSYRNLDHVDWLVNRLVGVERRETRFKSQLPRTLNLTADYRWRGPWYVGAQWSQSLLSRYAVGVRTFSRFALIPRYEKVRLEAALPLTLADDYRRLTVGAMLRWRTVFVGTDNVVGTLGGGRVTSYDLYAGVAVALGQQKPADRDHDGVSDTQDECPDTPGVWEFRGCPDRDGDHLADRDDHCPDDPGPLELHGCPDRDGDGIIDRSDRCPDQPGVAEFQGCPDRDRDHVTDSLDRCPDVPGDPAHSGCPDTDADGLYDHEDDCPRQAGPAENRGCPLPDRDSDGTPDATDDCPLTPGPATNRGCPVLTPVEVQILNTAFANLEFEFRRAVIRPESLPALAELAELLRQKPTYRLRLAGHTDNVGTPAFNRTLSRRRAEAVRDYLVTQGVEVARVDVEFYGATRPLDTNQTAAGRERNRRVEMTVLFE